MLIPKHRLETSIETHTQPLLIEERFEVPSKKRGFRGVYNLFQKTKLTPIYKYYMGEDGAAEGQRYAHQYNN